MSQHMAPARHAAFRSFGEVLRFRAGDRPTKTALTWLDRLGSPTASWDFATLDRRALALASQLVERGLSGERALLMFPPGLAFVETFFACLHAGVVAIPVYPPDPSRLERSLPRFLALVADSGATAVLTTSDVAQLAGPLLQHLPALQHLQLVEVDGLTRETSSWSPPTLTPDDVAFIQYSSGSTGTPKGIVVTHGNLLGHAAVLQALDNDQPGRSGLFWLPSYHDLGLIAGILQPVYYGVQTTLMSPIDFMKRPLVWLQAVSAFRPTHTGGPNFGYDLAVRRFDPRKLEGVDLSSVEVFVNAAERVRKETIDRFVETFAPYGVRREQFGPAYGLAEATLVVSARYDRSEPRCLEVDRRALAAGQARPADEDVDPGDRLWLVGVGQARGGVELAIVDPATSVRLEDGRTGEIWVRSPAVASGYLGRPEETEATFGARLPDDPDPWLRTGDIGFLHDGELFVTARLKDLVILRGRNLAPEDLERSVEHAHPDVRPGCVAAFSVDIDGEERLVVAAEVREGADRPSVEQAVRDHLLAEDGLATWRVQLLSPRTIPKTSSGKIQRHAARAAFLDRLEEERARIRRVEAWLVEQIAGRLPDGPREIDRSRTILSYGIDSLEGVALVGDLEELVGRELSPRLVFDNPTLTVLAERVARSPGA